MKIHMLTFSGGKLATSGLPARHVRTQKLESRNQQGLGDEDVHVHKTRYKEYRTVMPCINDSQ
jgi:hypothetical protein